MSNPTGYALAASRKAIPLDRSSLFVERAPITRCEPSPRTDMLKRIWAYIAAARRQGVPSTNPR